MDSKNSGCCNVITPRSTTMSKTNPMAPDSNKVAPGTMMKETTNRRHADDGRLMGMGKK